MARDKPAEISAETRVITGGRGRVAEVVNTPIYRASTHLYEDCASLRERVKDNADGHFFYGRRGSPTQWALCEALTELGRSSLTPIAVLTDWAERNHDRIRAARSAYDG